MCWSSVANTIRLLNSLLVCFQPVQVAAPKQTQSSLVAQGGSFASHGLRTVLSVLI